ncbi:MAG TPA: alpha/beta fold hydrolase [Streptosporangiaceae bacterium]|nr:alpha/beta fold hydrolase [Streptosporangiaceae bacterium]
MANLVLPLPLGRVALGRSWPQRAATMTWLSPLPTGWPPGRHPAEQAAFMADSQVPWGVNALSGAVTEPGWRIEPSWYLVASNDRMIPPSEQRAMCERARSTVAVYSGSHAIYVSQPAAMAGLIAQAAEATGQQA